MLSLDFEEAINTILGVTFESAAPLPLLGNDDEQGRQASARIVGFARSSGGQR